MNTLEKYWFDGKIRYPEIQNDGFEKNMTREFMIPAVTFGEAEEKLIKTTETETKGNYEVTSITKTKVEDVHYHDKIQEDNGERLRWYKVKVNFLWVDDNGKERKDSHFHMVQAISTDEVNMILQGFIESTVDKSQIADIVETKVVDCLAD